MIVITTITSQSVTLSWGPPTEANGVITKYEFQCSAGEEHVFNRTVMGSQTTTTLSGLLPYTSYSCSITAHTSVGGGPAATTSVTTQQDSKLYSSTIFIAVTLYNTVPSGPPQNFTISTTSRTLTLSWSPPLPSQRNGVIISYLITYSSGGSIINSTRTSSTSLTITGLQPFTSYTCTVSAATIRGDGPATAVISGVTDEDSECSSLHITVHCYSFSILQYLEHLLITIAPLIGAE